jgi:NitT/TauT family transport system substrate-binding protein
MSRPGFERLGSSFLSGGALKRSPVFESCVAVGMT